MVHCVQSGQYQQGNSNRTTAAEGHEAACCGYIQSSTLTAKWSNPHSLIPQTPASTALLTCLCLCRTVSRDGPLSQMLSELKRKNYFDLSKIGLSGAEAYLGAAPASKRSRGRGGPKTKRKNKTLTAKIDALLAFTDIAKKLL